MDESAGAVAALSSPQEGSPSGVGGWLLVLCIWLVGVIPLANIGIVGYSLLQTVPAWDRVQGLLLLDVLNAFTVAALMVLSVYAGLSLWRRRDAGALKVLRVFLIAFLLSKPVAAALPFVAGMDTEVALEVARTVLMGMGASVVFPMVVLTYTLKSARVRNTYGPVVSESA